MNGHHNSNKSFARRVGKSLSSLQKDLLENELPRFLLKPDSLPDNRYVAEIGIGNADHFVKRALAYPDSIHIGFEPYLNGVANCLKLIKSDGVENIKLWANDFELMWDKLPDSLFSELYVLFPDPWPKLKHHKRRLLNASSLQKLASKMHAGAQFYFVSDIDDYLDEVVDIVIRSGLFEDTKVSTGPYEGYIKTKYHLKAEREGRSAKFLNIHKKVNIS